MRKRLTTEHALPGLSIRATVTTSPLGRLLVATTARGICSIALGDSEQALLTELDERFPGAEVSLGVDRARMELVRAMFHEARVPHGLELELFGTPFQRDVWRELQAIPRGTTTTYSAIARRLGAPRAVRAIGTACGRNPVAFVVPCHRVLREDGELGGYRWGLERKRQLLAREARD